LKTRVEPRKVLVVDDYPVVCEALRLMLEFDGHEVTIASCGSEALARAQTINFDLVVTDYFLPGMRGDEVAAAFKERCHSLPVIMLTAAAPQGRPMNSDIILEKPCSLGRLRSALQHVWRDRFS
jgi:CheY-like chemotaxis protein